MSDITLSAGIRANLLSLQQTADLMSTTQNRLATGKKVNSALDNPLNFFQSSSLSARANDLSGLLDAMGNGISTIQAANNGINAITSLVQQLKATVSQARADGTNTKVALTSTANTGTGAADQLNIKVAGVSVATVATNDGSGPPGVASDVDTLVSDINASAAKTSVFAYKDSNNHLALINLTTQAVTIEGIASDGSSVTGQAADVLSVGASSGVRTTLANTFNDLLTQIDKAAGDAGYNGINLLNGDDLKLNFNENGTSNIDIQSKDASGNVFVLTSSNLGFSTATAANFADNATLDNFTSKVATALTTLRTQASSLGSSLSVVQTRKDFTKNMINTLQTGADNLVLADTNEEGANLLALQTRQSLSTTALSLSAQADQNVLRLFG
jgi:flagellin